MSYEINIISVGQTTPSSGFQPSKILIRNETEHDERRYFKIWPLFSHMDGILYSLGQNWDGTSIFSAFPICDADFEAGAPIQRLPEFLPPDVKETLTPLIIYKEYYPEVERCIRMLVQDSPFKTIWFQTRYQGGDYKVICGTLTLSQFLERLKTRRILFNVCYIVRDDAAIEAELGREAVD